MDSSSRKPQSKHYKHSKQAEPVEEPNCPGLRGHVVPGQAEHPEGCLASEAMDIDGPTLPERHKKEEVEVSYDEEGLREPSRLIFGVDHQAPDVPPRIPHKTNVSERKDLPEDALKDISKLKSQLVEAEKRVTNAEKRADDAEHQTGQSRLSWLPGFTNKPDGRDLQLRHLKENESRHLFQIQDLQLKVKDLKEGVQHLKENNRYWMEKATQYEADIKQIQEKSIKEMSDGRWNPVPDQDIHDSLYALHQEIRDWAKKWASGSEWLHSLPPDTSSDSVLSFLKRFVLCDSSGALPKVIANPIPKLSAKIPWLLLSAALADVIQHEFFNNPLFCVDEKYARALKETYMDLIKGLAPLTHLRPLADLEKANPREAHIWRSTLWRIMNPPGANQSRSATSNRVRNLCNYIGSEFKKGPAKILLRHDELEDARNERGKSLRSILEKAAKIATSLWVQRSFLRSMGLYDFIQDKIPFSVESPIMESHRLNKVDVDDTSHNGRGILIVVRPALLGFEEDDMQRLGGSGYRVLAKAIVFLDDRAPLSFEFGDM